MNRWLPTYVNDNAKRSSGSTINNIIQQGLDTLKKNAGVKPGGLIDNKTSAVSGAKAQPKPTPPAKAPTPTPRPPAPAPSPASRVPTPPPAPNPPALEVYKPDTSVLDYHRPDYDAFSKSWADIMSTFSGLKDSFAGQQATARDNMRHAFERTSQDIADGRAQGAREFGKVRNQINESSLEDQMAIENSLSARGLGDSGVGELAELNAQMRAGQQISDIAGDYYDVERDLSKTASDAQRTLTEGEKSLDDSSKAYLAELAQQEAHMRQQQSTQKDDLVRQETTDRVNMDKTKQEWERTYTGDKNQVTMWQEQWKQTQREFQAQQTNAERSYQTQLASIQAQKDSAAKSQALAQAKWDFDKAQALRNQSLVEADKFFSSGGVVYNPGSNNPFINQGAVGASAQADSFSGLASGGADALRKAQLQKNNDVVQANANAFNSNNLFSGGGSWDAETLKRYGVQGKK